MHHNANAICKYNYLGRTRPLCECDLQSVSRFCHYLLGTEQMFTFILSDNPNKVQGDPVPLKIHIYNPDFNSLSWSDR